MILNSIAAWLNNCVGHYNHRYFFMYTVYMTLGTIFIIVSGMELAYDVVCVGKFYDSDGEEELIGHPVRFNDSIMIPVTEGETKGMDVKKWQRACIIYIALLCTGRKIRAFKIFNSSPRPQKQNRFDRYDMSSQVCLSHWDRWPFGTDV